MVKIKPVVLDGRTLEGGGQLLRNALCISALTKTPLSIHSIRGNRSGGGGLKAQHLACVRWLAEACEADVTGAKLGSAELDFIPSQSPQVPSRMLSKTLLNGGDMIYKAKVNIGTAGSTTLALQAILPFIMFCPKPDPLPVHLELIGGTNVSTSPSYEYIAQVLLPTLQSMGLPTITPSIPRRGMNSIGKIELIIPPIPLFPLPGFTLGPALQENVQHNRTETLAPERLRVTFVGPDELREPVQSTMNKLAMQYFPDTFALSSSFATSRSRRAQTTTTQTVGEQEPNFTFDFCPVLKGFYVLVTATSSSSSSSSQRSYILARDLLSSPRLFNSTSYSSSKSKSKASESNLTRALEKIIKDLAWEWATGACVDEHLRDQIVIFRALAQGTSRVEVGRDGDGRRREASLHAQTAEWVAEKMLGAKFDEVDGSCTGIGFIPGRIN